MDDEFARRFARNEELYRQLNERIVAASDGEAGAHDATLQCMCECADVTCEEMLGLTLDEYRGVRESPTQFLVKPGHVLEEIERVVVENARHWVVNKVGRAADAIRKMQPAEE